MRIVDVMKIDLDHFRGSKPKPYIGSINVDQIIQFYATEEGTEIQTIHGYFIVIHTPKELKELIKNAEEI
jgi:hypothetical protein